MFVKILRALGVLIVGFIVFFIVKMVLETLGIIIPSVIITLVGLLILIAVVIYAIRVFSLDI